MRLGFIYIIENDINDKVYIGKTKRSIKRRFYEHCRDANKTETERRPQYRAMRKYGIEHFRIRQLEECENPMQEEREKFWISTYGSFDTGYNATIGGDGKTYLDLPEKLICEQYMLGLSMIALSNEYNCSRTAIRIILESNHVSMRTPSERNSHTKERVKRVEQYDLVTSETLKIYSSISEAEMDMHGGTNGHIPAVCKGERKSAHGFGWRYADN